jgi:hypothetical protein
MCPYCANQSVGYAKDISELGKVSFFGFHFEPCPMGQEANRIRLLLESKEKLQTSNSSIFRIRRSANLTRKSFWRFNVPLGQALQQFLLIPCLTAQ